MEQQSFIAYVPVGTAYVKDAERSLRKAWKQQPKLPICLVKDIPSSDQVIVIKREMKGSHRHFMLEYIINTPSRPDISPHLTAQAGVRYVLLLIDAVPQTSVAVCAEDSMSSVAPYLVVNVGNTEMVKLLDLIGAPETSLGHTKFKNFLTMQPGVMHANWADTAFLRAITAFCPSTQYRDCVKRSADCFSGSGSR